MSFESWLQGSFLDPVKGAGTVQDEIQCYSIPYGYLGIISHLITYWTVGCLALGLRPIWPFSKPWSLLKHSKLDMTLALLSVITCIPLAAFTIRRCHDRWQFVLVAVWKLVTSITLSCVGLHRSVELRHKSRTREITRNPIYWLALYILGVVAGMIGLVSLVIKTWEFHTSIRAISFSVAAALAIFLLMAIGVAPGIWWKLFWLAMGAGVASALYGDMVLAAIAGAWYGVPSRDAEILYWSWFVAKRLPMFSM